MTPPIRPEQTSNPALARVRRNLAKLRERGATREQVDAYLASERVTPEQVIAETPRTMAEDIRGGLQSVAQGATFNFADELAGAVGTGIDEQRESLRQFREANPKTAFALEMAGGLMTGAPIARGVLRGAQMAGRTIPQMLRGAAGAGAAGGAVAGVGAGDDAGERILGGVGGGLLGAGLGAGVAKLATSPVGDVAAQRGRQLMDVIAQRPSTATAGAAVPSTVTMPTPAIGNAPNFREASQRAVARALGFGDTAESAAEAATRSRSLLDVIERAGMGADVMTMNVGDDLAVRAARAAANQPGSRAGQLVNERLARQGGRLGEAVPADVRAVTGASDEMGAIALDRMLTEAQEAARPFYDEARQLGNVFPERGARQRTQRAVSELVAEGVPEAVARESVGGVPERTEFDRFMDSPLVQSAIARARRFPEFADLPDTDMRLLDKVYKELGDLSTEAAAAGNREGARDIRVAGESFRQMLAERAPVYGQATAAYRGVAAPRQAFEEGMESLRAAPGEITLALRGDTPLEQQARRLGMATSMQSAARGRASNADLGELAQFRDVARSLVGTPEQRDRIVEMFGRPTYDALLERLMPKIRAAAQNAAARGNSTTTKQLLDALAFGDDAMLDAVGNLMTGGSQGMLRGALQAVRNPLDRAYRLGVGQTAEQAADMLTTAGAPQVRSLIDVLEQRVRDDAARRAVVAPIAGAVTRTTAGRATP